ncbi:MAG TPA: FimV/HubP family polar landmark protein [Gammaproteobacteria bacterium]|nr:FimV/HubP family polar landmark protein [Gammaproteobacteria bacterium]
MVRKLLIVLVSLMAISPIAAYALGFGNIKLNSALNEPLNADISLLSATPQDVSGLTVKLAGHDAFANAGIDRTAVLNELKFTVKSRANGSYYIHVTSRQPIREPYLDFLLELNWSHGRMLREYTVLLDPPNLMRKQPTMVAPATTEAPSTIARTEAPKEKPAPKKAEQAPAQMPVPPSAPTQAAPAPKPPKATAEAAPMPPPTAPQPEQKAPAPSPAPEAAPAPAKQVAQAPEKDRGLMPYIPIGGEEETPVPMESGKAITHITKKGDKLWNIAEEMRPDDVTVYQMMMALLASNPDAFQDHNVNRLKAGYVLRVQDPSLLHEMSRQAAAHEFKMQTQAWEDYRQRVAGSASKQPMVTASQGQSAPAEGGSGEPKGHLKLVTPSGKGKSAGTGQEATKLKAASDVKDLAEARKQLNLAIEAAATERRKNAEMTDRLKELEKQIKDMQRLISLKDDELASLQQQLKAQEKARQEKAATPAPPAKQGAATPAPAESTTAPTESAAAPAAPPAQGPTGGTGAGSTTSEATGGGGGAKPPSAPGSGPGSPSAKATEPAPAHQAPPVSSPPRHIPWWKKLMNTASGLGKNLTKSLSVSPLLLAGGAALLLVILLLLLIVVRRRKKGYGFQESILTGEGAADSETSAASGASQGEESSFLSDFAVSGVNAIQTEDNEVDPLTEADVYMAYGRNQQAEELLTEALKTDPKRKELKLKLLELYHATKNKAGFEQTAEDLYADIGNDNDPMWTKVVAMGAEVAPTNPLFASAAKAAPAGAAAMANNDVMDIGLDTGVFDLDEVQGGGAETAATTAPPDSGLDFDFDLGGGETATEAAAEAAPDEGGGLDFNLDFTEPEAPAAAPETASAEEPQFDTGGDDGGLDFSLDFDTGGAPAASEEPAADQGGGLEFDLGGEEQAEEIDFDLGGLDTGSPASEEFPVGSDTEIDIGSSRADQTQAIDFDFDTGAAEGGLDEGGDLDEVGTKLDLAKAYIDMGDPEGARSILDEVMEEGSDSQKQEAQELMTQIV